MTYLNHSSQQQLYDVFTISHTVYLTMQTANYSFLRESITHCYKKQNSFQESTTITQVYEQGK